MSTPQRSWATLALLPATAGLFGGTLAWAVTHDPAGAEQPSTTILPAGSRTTGDVGSTESGTGAAGEPVTDGTAESAGGTGLADGDLAELADRVSEARERIESLRATPEDLAAVPVLPAGQRGVATAPAAGADTAPPVDATTGAS